MNHHSFLEATSVPTVKETSDLRILLDLGPWGIMSSTEDSSDGVDIEVSKATKVVAHTDFVQMAVRVLVRDSINQDDLVPVEAIASNHLVLDVVTKVVTPDSPLVSVLTNLGVDIVPGATNILSQQPIEGLQSVG